MFWKTKKISRKFFHHSRHPSSYLKSKYYLYNIFDLTFCVLTQTWLLENGLLCAHRKSESWRWCDSCAGRNRSDCLFYFTFSCFLLLTRSVMHVHPRCLSSLVTEVSAVQIKGSRLCAASPCLSCHVCDGPPVRSQIRVRRLWTRLLDHSVWDDNKDTTRQQGWTRRPYFRPALFHQADRQRLEEKQHFPQLRK